MNIEPLTLNEMSILTGDDPATVHLYLLWCIIVDEFNSGERGAGAPWMIITVPVPSQARAERVEWFLEQWDLRNIVRFVNISIQIRVQKHRLSGETLLALLGPPTDAPNPTRNTGKEQ